MLRTVVVRRITDMQLACEERDCNFDSAFDRPKSLDNAMGYCYLHFVITVNHYIASSCFNV